jgi:hypothetical protein
MPETDHGEGLPRWKIIKKAQRKRLSLNKAFVSVLKKA